MNKTDKEVSEIIMGKLKTCFRHSISSAVWHGSKLEIEEVIETMQKQFTLQILFPKEPLKKIIGNTTCYVPLTWIDHLRLDHLPNFLKNKYPIKFKPMIINYEHEVGAIYPKFPFVFPKQEVRFYEYKKL